MKSVNCEHARVVLLFSGAGVACSSLMRLFRERNIAREVEIANKKRWTALIGEGASRKMEKRAFLLTVILRRLRK